MLLATPVTAPAVTPPPTEAPVLAFDLEIAKTIDTNQDWHAQRPFGIACAGFFDAHAHGELVFASVGTLRRLQSAAWTPFELSTDTIVDPQFSRRAAQELVYDLEKKQASGARLVSWNGLGFDFRTLAEESGLRARCSRLALGHCDLMFQMFMLLGFTKKLGNVARASGLDGQVSDLSGVLAPAYWRQGHYQPVLTDLQRNCVLTAQLAEKAARGKALFYYNQSLDYAQRVRVEKLLTVAECLQLPDPDTSWMRDGGWTKGHFAGWLR